MNPEDVLTATDSARLAKARDSDKTVIIRTPAEVTARHGRPKAAGTLTWQFHMKNTRDVAFGASTAFVWDAAKINLPEGKTSLAMSVYPRRKRRRCVVGPLDRIPERHPSSTSRRSGIRIPGRRHQRGRASPQGMEYPGIVFDGMKTPAKALLMVTAHEIGHTGSL